MSIVIVGGHDRMVGQYKKICKSYKCKCKVFTQMEADFGKKMVKCALDEVGASTDIVRCHTSSGNALNGILEARC